MADDGRAFGPDLSHGNSLWPGTKPTDRHAHSSAHYADADLCTNPDRRVYPENLGLGRVGDVKR